jgi:hypothetical protein
MINFKKLENICASIIVLAFFLPWLDLGFISFSGYSLPNLANSMGSIAQSFDENTQSSNYGVYLVYLVPLLACLVLLFSYLNKPSKNISLASGFVNIIGFCYHLITQSDGSISMYGIGIWITLLASIVMVLSSLGYIKRTI